MNRILEIAENLWDFVHEHELEDIFVNHEEDNETKEDE